MSFAADTATSYTRDVKELVEFNHQIIKLAMHTHPRILSQTGWNIELEKKHNILKENIWQTFKVLDGIL